MKRIVTAALVAVAFSACGGGSSPSIDASKALRDGASVLAQLKTVTATLKITKGTISIQGFALVSARTAVNLPTDSDTTYTVKEQDIQFSLEVVIASGHVYIHLPLTPFAEAPASEAAAFPDMARLFATQSGLPVVIPAGSSPKYVSTEQVDGQSAYQISTSYSPAQVHGLLSELNSSGPVSARVWVDVSDHKIRKAVLAGAFGDGGTNATVEVDITGFDTPVVISSPTP